MLTWFLPSAVPWIESSFDVLPVVVFSTLLFLLETVNDSVATNKGVSSVPSAMVEVIDLRVVIGLISSTPVFAVSSNACCCGGGITVPAMKFSNISGCSCEFNAGVDGCNSAFVDVSSWGGGGCVDVPLSLLFVNVAGCVCRRWLQRALDFFLSCLLLQR